MFEKTKKLDNYTDLLEALTSNLASPPTNEQKHTIRKEINNDTTFQSIVEAFYSTSEKLKVENLPRMIELSTEVFGDQSSSQVLKAVLSSLTSLSTSDNSLPELCLFKSWLQLLVFGGVESDSILNPPLISKAVRCLEVDDAMVLFDAISSFIWNKVNFGLKTNNQFFNLNRTKLEISILLLKFLLSVKTEAQTSTIQQIISSFLGNQKVIETGLSRLIQWTLLNEPSNNLCSQNLTKELLDLLLELFGRIEGPQDLIQFMIKELITSSEQILREVSKLEKSKKINHSLALNYQIHTQKIKSSLLDLWTRNVTTSGHAIIDLKILEASLEGISKIRPSHDHDQPPQTNFDENDLLAYFIRLKDYESSQAQKQVCHILEDELSQKLLVRNESNQETLPQNWSRITKKNQEEITSFKLDKGSPKEIVLLIQLENPVDLSQLSIAFNTIDPVLKKSLHVPTSVNIEAGSSEIDFSFKSALEPIQNLNAEGEVVKSFAIDFKALKVKKNESLFTVLQSINHEKVSHIRLTIQRMSPVAEHEENKISVHFLSILALSPTKRPDSLQIAKEISDKFLLEDLRRISKYDFGLFKDQLSSNKNFVSTFQEAFKVISIALIPYEDWLAPLLLSLAATNTEINNLIFKNWLDRSKSKEHGKLICEIAITDKNTMLPRMNQILQFILSELKAVIQLKKSESLSQFIKLVPFIEHFSNTAYLVPTLFYQHEQLLGSLAFSTEDLDFIINSFNHHIASSSNTVLIQLLILLLYPPLPFKCSDDSLSKHALEKVWTYFSKERKFSYSEMLGTLIIGSKSSAKWFLSNLESLFSGIEGKLDKFTPLGAKVLRSYLNLANIVSCNDLIKKTLFANQWHVKIYKVIKSPQSNSSTILKDIEKEILNSVISLLKNMILGYPKSEEELCQLILDDLSQFSSKHDPFYVNSLFIPLLNAETELPVCLYPCIPQTGRVVTSFKKTTTTNKEATVTNDFPSEIINPDSSEILMKTIQRLKKQGKENEKGKWERVLRNTTDQQNILPQIKEKVSQKGPFLVLVEGVAAGGISAGAPCCMGIYSASNLPDFPAGEYDNGEVDIPNSTESFVFYYDSTHHLHFPTNNNSDQGPLGFIEINSEDGSYFSFILNSSETLLLSFGGEQTTARIDLAEMGKDLDNTANLPNRILEGIQFKSIEFWVFGSSTETVERSAPKAADPLKNVFLAERWDQTTPLKYFRGSSIFKIPSSLPVGKFAQRSFGSSIPLSMRLTGESLDSNSRLAEISEFIQRKSEQNGILDLDFDLTSYWNSTSGENKDDSVFLPTKTFFESFERIGGIKAMVNLGLQAIENWQSEQEKAKWKLWLQEILSFGSFPNYFMLFFKNQDYIILLLRLIVGEKDKLGLLGTKKIEESAAFYSYQVLAEIFKVETGNQLREIAIEQNFIRKVLDRIGFVTKETCRKWHDQLQSETEEFSSPTKTNNQQIVVNSSQKKKGVGYGTDASGSNQTWDVDSYLKGKQSKNELLISTLEILTNFFQTEEWQPSEEFIRDICESALLPMIETSFRSSSFLDITKEAQLYRSYFALIKAMASQKKLLICFLDLDKHYQPAQKESIYSLFGRLKSLAEIFLNCLNTANHQAQDNDQDLAKEILKTFDFLKEKLKVIQVSSQSDGLNLTDALSQPLPQAYRFFLQNLRFDYTDMKNAQGQYQHHFQGNITNVTPSQQKLIRLAQELADMSSSLPIEHTNSIFIRVDESRVDVMKALITGAAGTPYGHGVYEFDIYFDDSYPQKPPQANLITTGNSQVRFNPNLYENGYICLSLLGTWRGVASENWDPKISTVLQVLLSIQAIIMCDDIYFNEPGYEGYAGTEEGARRNEGYSNVVKYCNIQYAMIGQIRNPPKGFEEVVRRHFYLKKDEILEEARRWITYAELREASYDCLIECHNSHWSSIFRSTSTTYKEMLTKAVQDLEEELNKLEPPSFSEKVVKQQTTMIKKKEKKIKETNFENGSSKVEEIDMTYETDTIIHHKEMNIQDEDVKDRWSRYIGAMGLDAVTKQGNALVFLSGLGALGIEIAKNIVLSGVKKITLHDDKKTSYRDLSGQFFLSEEDVGKNRVQVSLNKLQQLNYYVQVDAQLLDQKMPKEEESLAKILSGYTLVILTENDYETQVAVNTYCRKNNIFFICADINGPFAKSFSDFGDEFTVLDKNGEEVQEVMIGNITNEERGLVTLLPGHHHKFEDGDAVLLHGIEGMGEWSSASQTLNQTQHTVQVINSSSFRIGDTRNFTPYIRNGIAKLIKIPKTLKFRSLQDSLKGDVPFDSNMITSDFSKMTHPYILHVAFQTLDVFINKKNRTPVPWNVADSEEFLSLAKEITNTINGYNPQEDGQFDQLIQRFCFTCQGTFPPLAAFLGGYVAQEALKALTQKFMPTNQLFYTDCYEVIPEIPKVLNGGLQESLKALGIEDRNDRYDGLRLCIGETLLQEIKDTNLFMVGAGAIGCELLKNFAMLGLGTGEANESDKKNGGKIVLTDPDVIEVSNLNRQFLFREKHLRKPKSQTAAAAALQMNKDLKGHIVARLERLHEGTANIFTDKFFEGLNVVANALDNVQARKYIDMRCVSTKTPLLESGTLGPKAHVQVILPYKTESYSSQEDPKDDSEIPQCTLKMFPEETLHCVEWARDKFGKIFTQRPKTLIKCLGEKNQQLLATQEIKALRDAVNLLEKHPKNFDDCIRYARLKFEKYFVNDIKQLLYTYPLDMKTKEGKPFWSLPKRPPVEIKFDPKNILHANMVTACACLRASIFNIPIPSDIRKEASKFQLAEEAAKMKVPVFKPSEERAKSINSEVQKESEGQEKNEENKEETKENDVQELLKKWKVHSEQVNGNIEKFCQSEEFEKDNDKNFHIDFIHALANCRASNYCLDNMDWITVKIKAGRIVPALATTTSSVAGLQTIELCKILKKCKVEEMRNTFLNLAVPIMSLSEPGVAPITKLTENLSVNIWDRWDVVLQRNASLKDLFEKLEKTYDLIPKDVSCGSQTVYFYSLLNMQGKEKERDERLSSKLLEILGLEKEDQYVDLSIMFSRKGDNNILKGVPMVRVIFDN